MKTILLALLLTSFATNSFGQWDWELNFDNDNYLERIYIDSVTNPNCLWRIGHPNKTIFTSAYSNPNAILTDTFNPVPSNDTSTFFLFHERDNFGPFHVFKLRFRYQMDGESTDYGIVEISPDSGLNWVNFLTEDTIYDMQWYGAKPTLKGSSNGWQNFGIYMYEWASDKIGNYPTSMTADRILFRFTYITDTNSSLHDGWIIDDFEFEDWWEGIEEYQNDNLISVYPNPTSDFLNLITYVSSYVQIVQIFNYTGQLVYENRIFKGEAIETSNMEQGLYLLKYSNDNSFSIKKIVVKH